MGQTDIRYAGMILPGVMRDLLGSQWYRRCDTGHITVGSRGVAGAGHVFTNRASPGPKTCRDPSLSPICSCPDRMITNCLRGAVW